MNDTNTPESRYVITAHPTGALATNDPRRVPCDVGSCDQLATVIYGFQHAAGGPHYTHNLCPQHTSEWIADAANPESEQWVGA